MGKKIAFVVTETYVFFRDMSVSTFVISIFDNFAASTELMDKLYKEKEDMFVIKSEKKGIWGWTIKTNLSLIKAEIQGIYVDIH